MEKITLNDITQMALSLKDAKGIKIGYLVRKKDSPEYEFIIESSGRKIANVISESRNEVDILGFVLEYLKSQVHAEALGGVGAYQNVLDWATYSKIAKFDKKLISAINSAMEDANEVYWITEQTSKETKPATIRVPSAVVLENTKTDISELYDELKILSQIAKEQGYKELNTATNLGEEISFSAIGYGEQ